MKLIAEFEVETASIEALPGESNIARLRRIAKAQCHPIRRVTTYLVPKEEARNMREPMMTMRQASDYMLAQITS